MNVPVVGFSHQEGHMEAIRAYSPFQTEDRFLACHFSGGTCEVLDVSETDLRKDGMPKQYFEGISGADDNGASAKKQGADDNGASAKKAKKPRLADPAERVAYTMHITGGTKDISFGQVLDRTGVALGMEFPAGGQLDLMAQKFCEAEQAEDPGEIFKGASRDMLQAAKEACRLTPVKVKDGWLNLSGLDTQARSRIDRLGLEQKQLQTYALAADLFAKTGKAASDMIIQCSEHSGRASVLLAGGVASSQFLRSHMRKELNGRGITAVFGDEMLSQDNAVGIALLGGKYLWG